MNCNGKRPAQVSPGVQSLLQARNHAIGVFQIPRVLCFSGLGTDQALRFLLGEGGGQGGKDAGRPSPTDAQCPSQHSL